MSWTKKTLGLVRLLVHKCKDISPFGYELLDSHYFSYDFFYKNIAKSRPCEEWMSDMLNEGNHSDFYEDIFKDIKQDDFYVEIIAELHAAWGYSGGEYNEYEEDCWFENERFRILTDKDVKEYKDSQKPFVEPPDIIFEDRQINDDSNSDLDTGIFFKDK